MTDQHDPRDLELIFAYEDLDDDQRGRADALLAADVALRRALNQVRAVEDAARRATDLGEDREFWSRDPVGETAEADRRHSLAAIRETVAWRYAAARPRRFRFHLGALLPAVAAVLALVIWSPWQVEQPVLLSGLRVEQHVVQVGAQRGSALASDEAFSLGFDLARDARVTVVHLDPIGDLAVVQNPVLLAGGRHHRIPDGGDVWLVTGEGGQESLIVVADEGGLLTAAEILDRCRVSVAGQPGRAAALAAMRTDLAGPTTQVDIISLEY